MLGLFEASYQNDRDLRGHLAVAAATQPKPGIGLHYRAPYWEIHVANLGPMATFRANARVLRNSVGGPTDSYPIQWVRSHDRESSIEPNGEDLFRLGSIKPDAQGLFYSLELWGIDPTTGTQQTYWDYNYVVGNNPAPEVELEITITAIPRMPNDPFCRRVRFGPLDADWIG